MPRALVASLALAALLALVLWRAAGSPQRRDGAAPGAEASTQHAAATPAELEPANAPSAAPAPLSPDASQREAAPTERERELARAHWIEGSVVFPPGTPADEELFVVADGVEFADGGDHRARVGRDGSFRVAAHEKSRWISLRLDGRWLYLREPAGWKLGSEELPILRPELGARVVARVLPAPGDEPLAVGGEVRLRAEGSGAAENLTATRTRSLDERLAPEFGALPTAPTYRLGYEGDALVGASATFHLQPGESREVELALARGVVLEGRVLDEDGAPLAGASVGASCAGASWSQESRRSDTSAADGSFRVGPLAPGSIDLGAGLEDYLDVELSLGPLDGPRAGLELVLRRGLTIAGVVRWPDGTPAEARVVAAPTREIDERGKVPRRVEASCDAHGRFVVTGLGEGPHDVRARASRADATSGTDEGTREARGAWTAEERNVVPGGTELVLTLEEGHSVAGRVVDERGTELADFRVGAAPLGGRMQGEVSRSFRDAGGAFELDGLWPGEWELWAEARGHARSGRVRATVPGSERVVLSPPREARVAGVVLDASGEPAFGASVRATQALGTGRLSFFAGETGEATGSDGRFELGKLAPGAIGLTASGASGAPSAMLELELAAGERRDDVVLRLRAGATLAGEVAGADGRAIAGATVTASDWTTGFYARGESDAEGRFELAALPPGALTAHAEIGSGITLARDVELREGETTRVRLAPEGAAPVRLHGLVRAGGEPLAAARVWANVVEPGRAESGDVRATTSPSHTDENGEYALLLPGAGRYDLSLDASGALELSWRVILDVPQVAELEHDVDVPLGRVSGRVTDSAGAPLAEVWVESAPVRHGGGPHGSSRAQTGDDGAYEILVPAGPVLVTAGESHWAPVAEPFVPARSGELAVAAGGHVRGVDLVLARGGSVEGVVRSPQGSPVSMILVRVDADESRRAWTDDLGRFRVDGLSPGTHRLDAGLGLGPSGSVEVQVGIGQVASVELVLAPATLVEVRVRDASGAEVGSELEALDGSGARVPLRELSPGRVLAGPLTAGRYVLRATREGKSAERTLELDGRSPTLEVVLALE